MVNEQQENLDAAHRNMRRSDGTCSHYMSQRTTIKGILGWVMVSRNGFQLVFPHHIIKLIHHKLPKSIGKKEREYSRKNWFSKKRFHYITQRSMHIVMRCTAFTLRWLKGIITLELHSRKRYSNQSVRVRSKLQASLLICAACKHQKACKYGRGWCEVNKMFQITAAL